MLELAIIVPKVLEIIGGGLVIGTCFAVMAYLHLISFD